jgi:two-component system cell cycle sensor histidine kinase/response regulator CckA
MSDIKPRNKKFLQTIFPFLIGPAERFSLENRLFSALMLTISLLCFIATIVNSLVKLPTATIVVMVVGVVFYSVYYFASRFKGLYKVHVWAAAVGTLLILIVLWQYNSGSGGGAHYFLIIAPLMFILFIRDWQRLLFLALYIGVTIGLLVIEYRYPSFVKGHIPRQAQFYDILASTVMTQVVVVLIVAWALRQYRVMLARVEELRRKSEERFNEMANQIPVVICELDLNRRITYANKTAFAVSGYSPADLAQGVFLDGIAHPDTMAAIRERTSALQSGQSVTPSEYSIVTKTGEQKTLFGSSSLIFSQGQPSGFRACMIDITEQKELEDRLHHAEKMESIGVLAGGIAHDFNNILTGILTAARMIESDVASSSPLEPESCKKNAGIIATAATRAAELVKKLLVFSRHGHHESIPFDCNDGVREAIDLLSHTLDKKIEIVREFHDGPLVVRGEQSLLESAVINLAVNAQDAMPGGGVLTIRTASQFPDAIYFAAHPHLRTAKGFAAISISDTGRGIDESVKEHLFEPFFTTKETGKGTGLGLASVYGTVKTLGGCIDVESEKGRGTTFTLFLPLSDQKAPLETPQSSASPAAGGETILIVDDEEIILKAEELALTRQGYTVRTFSDPASALDFYRDRHGGVACVIIDMVMPKMSGKQLFERLRAINPAAKVILTTGYAGDPDFNAFVKSSGALFVPKPFDATVMGRAIRKAIGEVREA